MLKLLLFPTIMISAVIHSHSIDIKLHRNMFVIISHSYDICRYHYRTIFYFVISILNEDGILAHKHNFQKYVKHDNFIELNEEF